MILFTADLHIKLGQKNVPVEWATRRYYRFLDLIDNIDHNLHIMGGDIFDRLPNLAELSIYFDMVKRCKTDTIIYPGNHEATKKDDTFFNALKTVTESLNNKVKIITKTTEFDKFTILPYTDLYGKNAIEVCNKNKVLFTHVRGEIPPHVKPEVDLDRFNDFPIVYAGDLHSHSNTQRNIVYPGSPMTTSFHRNLVDTGYLLIDEQDLTKWTWHKLDLPQLIRKTITNTDDMVPTTYHHTIYEVEGNLQELSTVANSDLLDKKIVKRNSEASINLLDKTLEEELAIYLVEVLELDDGAVQSALEVFNAYAKRTEVG
jgi:hypothetical protein